MCVCVRARAYVCIDAVLRWVISDPLSVAEEAHVCIDAVLSWVISDPLSVAEEGQLSCALYRI